MSRPDAVRLVIFDLDGTLLDTPSAIVDGFTGAFEAAGRRPPASEAIRNTIGQPLDQAFRSLLGTDDTAAIAEVTGCYQSIYRDRIVPRAPGLLYPGVAAGLALLARRGMTLTIATNKATASAEAILAAAGVRRLLSAVYGADRVKRPKPHPEAGLALCGEFRVPPAQAVMIGDTEHDVMMANRAGIRSIAVTYGVQDAARLRAQDPTWIAGTFDEVIDLIERSNITALPPRMPPAAGLPAQNPPRKPSANITMPRNPSSGYVTQ